MSDPHSIVMLPPKEGRQPAPPSPLPWTWQQARRYIPVATALLIGWAFGFVHGRSVSHVEPPVVAPPALLPAEPETSPVSIPSRPTEETPDLSLPKRESEATTAASLTPAPELAVAPAPAVPARAQSAALSIPTIGSPALRGTVHIDSKPVNAQVYAGDKLLGDTPLVLENVAAGPLVFRVEKERHTRKTVETRLKAGGQVDLQVELQYDPEPRPGESFTNGQEVRMQWVGPIRGWAAAVETTQGVYQAITHENPSENVAAGSPVTNVSWTNAMKFCELLTIAERSLGFLPEGHAYTLPADEEWSSLASGTPLSQAVTSRNGARQGPAPAGSLPANSLGLFDIRGNVWEWCRDSYTGEVHRRELVENATGDDSKVNLRHKILRGGSWNRSLDANLGIGFRLAADGKSHKDYETGFRVVLIRTP